MRLTRRSNLLSRSRLAAATTALFLVLPAVAVPAATAIDVQPGESEPVVGAADERQSLAHEESVTASTLTLRTEWVDAQAGATAKLSINGEPSGDESVVSESLDGSGVDQVNVVTVEVLPGDELALLVELAGAAEYSTDLLCDEDGLDYAAGELAGTYAVPGQPSPEITCTFTHTPPRQPGGEEALEREQQVQDGNRLAPEEQPDLAATADNSAEGVDPLAEPIAIDPPVTLRKEWVNGQAGDTASLSITGDVTGGPVTSSAPDAPSGDNSVTVNAIPGDVLTLTEVVAGGQYTADLECVQGEDQVLVSELEYTDGDRAGTLTVPDTTDPITCTFTNTRRTPGPGETTLRIFKAGDRLASGTRPDNVSPLAGSTFHAIAGNSGQRVNPPTTPLDPALSCTTNASGTCDIIVPDRTGTTGIRANGYWIVETQAPDGWRPLGRVGTADSIGQTKTPRPYTFFTGNVSGTTSVEEVPRESTAYKVEDPGDFPTPSDTLEDWWVDVRENPPIPRVCGFSIALVFDRSGSTGPFDEEYKNAGKLFVGEDGLGLTPTSVSIYQFGGSVAERVLPTTSLATTAGIAAAQGAIDGLRTPQGGTPWDQALRSVAFNGDETYDIVLFLTDGDPTLYSPTNGGDGGNGSETDFATVEYAAVAANSVKTMVGPAGQNTRILGVGIGLDDNTGSEDNIIAITGPTQNSDYVLSDFATLGQLLKDLAQENCGGTLTVVKEIVDENGTVIDDSPPGWDFTARADGDYLVDDGDRVAELTRTTPDSTGAVNFEIDFEETPNPNRPQTLSVTETLLPGFELFTQGDDDLNATCTSGGVPIEAVNDGGLGFRVSVDPGAVVSCLVLNTPSTGFLRLAKVFDPLTSGFDGTFSVAYECTDGTTGSADLAAGGETTVGPIPTGTECTVSEPTLPEPPAGWTFGEPTFDPDPPTVTITKGDQAAAVGVEVTNTITRDTAELTLVKEVDPADAGDPAAWTLSATSADDGISGSSGTPAVTDQSVSTGDYTLAEAGGPGGFTAGEWACVADSDEPGDPVNDRTSLTLNSGDDVVCTIVNTANEEPERPHKPDQPQPEPPTATPPAPPLARTGADGLGWLALGAGVLVASGAGLVWFGRRRGSLT